MGSSAGGEIRHLRFDAIAPGGALHAALFAQAGGGRGFSVGLHDHDFYEMMFVLAGAAAHPVNGAARELRPGDLVFLRPPDVHAIQVPPGGKLHHINVAFPADAWRRFCEVAGGVGAEWETGDLPAAVSVPEERRAACAAVFQAALLAFQRHPDPRRQGLDLCRFLSGALPFLWDDDGGEADDYRALADSPPWLAETLRRARRDGEVLREGLPRLAAIAGVSPSHLARTLKAATGQTPTAFLNDLRLARAATLLTTTTLPIAEVSADCGFSELSYFYRLFRGRYGCPPHAYRQQARRSVAP